MATRTLKGKGKVAPLENSPFGEDVAKRVSKAGNELLKVGALTAKGLVDYSRDPKAITHKDVFHCSPEEAQESHWLDRAKALLGCVYVVNVKTGKPARMFHSVMSVAEGGEARRSYRPLGEVIGDPNMLGQLSLECYAAMCSTCARVESLGLDADPAWRRLIAAVKTTVPAGAK
jgi:hypothetical protein